ncbi:MAG TPA: protein kinase [Phycisphaerales bacterium]|nr:protein kinase [Phycisphaerales bacterium]
MDDSRIRAWFDAAAHAAPEERRRILSEARATDPREAEELESLLAHLDSAGVLDATPLTVASLLGADALSSDDAPPCAIGPFTILKELGRGGMGVVYEAQQSFPRRKVALKVIRPELIRSSLLRRFAREAGALALLQHEGIAQLYEAGFADATRRLPYIAMELVEGQPITAYANAHNLATSERLALLARVADAVDHAHRKGVLHRDLKPGNILVTEGGNPKVLDFGVSRLTAGDALDQHEPDHTATAHGQIIGTLGYMSPEQLAGNPRDIDHRADVYALGVILYELLAGRPPFDLSSMSLTQATLTLREQEPTPLSRLNPRLKGDLTAITHKALEADPQRRYQSAADLASDLRRHLSNEPVLARPQTTLYQAHKFARRHKGLVAGLALAALFLVAGAAATTWQAIKATRERALAQEQELRAKETAALLTRFLRSATPEVAQGTEPTVREMLDRASADLASDKSVHPAVAADTHQVLAEAYGDLGDFPKAESHARTAINLMSAQRGVAHTDTLRARGYLARLLTLQHKDADALSTIRAARADAERSLLPDDPVTLRIISLEGLALAEPDDPQHRQLDAGLALLKHAHERIMATQPPTSGPAITSLQSYGTALARAGKHADAAPLLKAVLDHREQALGPDHPDTLHSIDNYLIAARDLTPQQQLDRRLDLLARADRVLGEDHPRTLGYRRNVVLQLVQAGKGKQALEQSKRLYEHGVKRLGPAHPDALDFRGLYVTILTLAKDLDTATKIAQEQHDISLQHYGEKHQYTYQSWTLLYDIAEAQGSLEKMREAANALRGSPWEEAVFAQLKAAEEKAAAQK